MKKKEINIFIFRRDLRFQDNLSLNLLLEKHTELPILPIFIFNPRQIDPNINKYFNNNAVEFMIQCLLELERNDIVYFFEGNDIDILTKLLNVFQIHTIAFNSDFTPFAKQRDDIIKNWCKDKKIDIITSDDYTLLPQNSPSPKKTYEVFTPFYNNFMTKLIKDVPLPKIHTFDPKRFLIDKSVFKNLLVKNINQYIVEPKNQKLAMTGGRSQALLIFNKIKRGEFANYEKWRDFPAANKTTRLSAYLKFGCVSIREAFQIFRPNKSLTRELLWREFYANITFTHPKILQGQITKSHNHAFREKYDSIPWKLNEGYWKAWVQAKTGFPFVDAGIRQLISTGFCHNRLRMVLGMFFSKDMMMDWTVFERWMASYLIDYDPSSNSGGTQWCFSIGTDAAPYYRVFNPFLQSERFDPKCEYIKKWVPELVSVPNKSIHKWDTDWEFFIKTVNYPKPMLNHSEQVAKAIVLFKK